MRVVRGSQIRSDENLAIDGVWGHTWAARVYDAICTSRRCAATEGEYQGGLGDGGGRKKRMVRTPMGVWATLNADSIESSVNHQVRQGVSFALVEVQIT